MAKKKVGVVPVIPCRFNPAANPEGKPEWSESFTEDYEKLDDETRRRVLLDVGYDPAHEYDAFRLFPYLAKIATKQDN